MRIVLVISNLEYGGAQRQVVELANNMDASRFDVHVCSLSSYVPLADRLRHRDRRLHIIAKKWKFDITVVPRLVRLLRRLRADVVHGYLFDAEIAARLAARLAGAKASIASERNTNYRLKPRQLITYRLTRSCVDLIIANSNAGAAFNSRMLGHKPSQYRVIHNGVDTQRFAPRDGGAIRRELGLAEDERVIGMFASYKPQKNHPMLFAAARCLLDRLPRARLLLVGDQLYEGLRSSDEYKRRIGRLADELGIRERCLFLGNRRDVQRLYCACDVTALPSLHEGTPNVALEAMACGVPVVATDVSDNAYVIPDGRGGFVVPLNDYIAMARRLYLLLTDERQRHQMGWQAREWVRREFSTKRLAMKTADAYAAVLAAKNGSCAQRLLEEATNRES